MIGSPAAIAFFSALALALVATPLVRRVARGARWLDRPDGGRKSQAAATPLLGGVAVWLALAISLAIAGALTLPTARACWPWIAAAGLACGIGCCDDLFGLRVRWKLLGQLVAATPLLAANVVIRRLDVAGFVIELDVLAIPFTLGWLLASMNAVNFLDGSDGLASSAGIVAATWLVFALAGAPPEAALTSAALAGALIGFLRYNRAPASIYLGDAGSLSLGLLWGGLVIQAASSQGAAGGVASISAMVAWMAVPLADLTLAVVRRVVRGKCFWIADRAHVHHRLGERGFSTRAIAGIGGAATCVLASVALLASLTHDLAGWAALLAAGALAVRFRWAGYIEWRLIVIAIRHWRDGAPAATEAEGTATAILLPMTSTPIPADRRQAA
jgi:UDP-GlcNAc:undecaprenyl-phosphate GlcNAc-1-phosphate transferase